MKSDTFSKRSGAATEGFESCEFWFQAAFFNLNTDLYFLGQYVCMEENYLKISLALYIRLEFSTVANLGRIVSIRSSTVVNHSAAVMKRSGAVDIS